MWEPDLVTSTSGRREGVAAAAPDGEPEATRTAFHRLMAANAAYVALRPSSATRRAAARRIADAVLQTGAELAEGGPNRWEVD